MRNRKVSKKQKRVRGRNSRTAKRISAHLLLGDQHDTDRKAAERLRSFPTVPRLAQPPFPKEREFGFAGHWVNGEFIIQNGTDFVDMNVAYKEQAFYIYVDPRGNRKPTPLDAGLVETNVSLLSGLTRELAALVEAGKSAEAQQLALTAGLEGMKTLRDRTGYLPAYMALHPDAYGTLSYHFGLWPIDPEKHCKIGRSAGGRPGRRGLRLLGDCYTAVMRHHEAIGLPQELVHQPLENIKERRPDDWAVAQIMDGVVRQGLGKLPDGEEILKRADDHQRKAAHEWLERFGRAGGYQQNEFKKKQARRKEAAKRLVSLSARRAKRDSEAAQSRINELQKALDAAQRKAEAVGSDVDRLRRELDSANASSVFQRTQIDEYSNHANQLEWELDGIRQLLNQAPGESIKATVERIVEERNQIKERFHWLCDQVIAFVRLIFSERFLSLLSKWPEEIRNGVEELAKALNGKPADIREPDKPELKGIEPNLPTFVSQTNLNSKVSSQTSRRLRPR